MPDDSQVKWSIAQWKYFRFSFVAILYRFSVFFVLYFSWILFFHFYRGHYNFIIDRFGLNVDENIFMICSNNIILKKTRFYHIKNIFLVYYMKKCRLPNLNQAMSVCILIKSKHTLHLKVKKSGFPWLFCVG